MPARPVEITVDRRSPVPLWHQVSEQLSGAVRDGVLQPGDPVENEVDLARRLGVSRPTIRRAMQALGEQGLLVRQRGVGTTVAPARVHRRAVLSSLHDDLVDDGLRPSTTVLSLDEVTDAVAATALELDPRTPLLHLSRLRAVDGRPLALMHNWLPVPREPLEAEELERGGLYAALRRRGAVPRVARQTVTARMPGAVERRQLDLPRGRPVLAMTRTAFGSQGEPVEHGQHCYDAAAYSLDLVLDER